MKTQSYDKPIYECPDGSATPIVIVENISGIKQLKGCYVYVQNINTTYYIDNRHNIIVINAGPVEATDYDLAANELNLRKQFLLNTSGSTQTMYYFDKSGVYHAI